MLMLVLLIVLDTPGGAIFHQERVGLRGKLFRILKFRTMVQDASLKGPYYTLESDSRITRVGKFLRRSSLDELPQLLNVVCGHMSLVGPRPEVLQQRQIYSEKEWCLRHSVRPGITGLAQATLRSSASVEDRKRLDLAYVENQSFMLDLRILAMTVYQVLAKGGH